VEKLEGGNKSMKKIAVINEGFVRDTQVFGDDPALFDGPGEYEDVWDAGSKDYSGSIFIGIFEGTHEGEIRKKVADKSGLHEDVIVLVDID